MSEDNFVFLKGLARTSVVSILNIVSKKVKLQQYKPNTKATKRIYKKCMKGLRKHRKNHNMPLNKPQSIYEKGLKFACWIIDHDQGLQDLANNIIDEFEQKTGCEYCKTR